MRCVIFSIISVLGLANVASAQTPEPAVYLLVEGLDPIASACGLSEQAIQGAANSALRYNRIRTGASSLSNMTFYVNVNVQKSGEMCATSINVELYKYQLVDVVSVGEMFAHVQFCHKGAMGVVLPSNPRTLQTVKDLTDSCLADTSVAVLNSID